MKGLQCPTRGQLLPYRQQNPEKALKLQGGKNKTLHQQASSDAKWKITWKEKQL